MDKVPYHHPVMVHEVVAQLPAREGLSIDATLGGGGHAEAIVQELCRRGIEKDSFLIGIDQDSDALAEAKKKLAAYSGMTRLVKANFQDIAEIVAAFRASRSNHMPVTFILLDLGVSSYQIDKAERGFSYLREGPLDMRMATDSGTKASDILNSMDAHELAGIFFRYGQERLSRTIAEAVCAWRRKNGDISSTGDLAAIVRGVVRGKEWQVKSLARIFQAVRIVVNDEMGVLERVLKEGTELLDQGGRMAVISYHSLEDRAVKRHFSAIARDDWGPKGVGLREPLRRAAFRTVTTKPIVASEDEVRSNPRSRSAKLRVVEKIETQAEEPVP